MKRFLPSRELARDLRFKRANSRTSCSAPCPTTSRRSCACSSRSRRSCASASKAPRSRRSSTSSGPGFMFLTTAAGTAQSTERTPLQLRAQLHGIFVGELQALEAAGRTLWDFPDAPWEFKMNMARQCWDEARHVQIYEKLIDARGRRDRRVPREHLPVRDLVRRRSGAARDRREPLPRGPGLRRVPLADRVRQGAAATRSSSRRSTSCSPTSSRTCASAATG